MQLQDSILVSTPAAEHLTDTVAKQPARPQTPYQVLRLLPKDATPAQQDSAIQAWFEPAEIHYSEQPDTLHLPGHSIPRDLKKVEIPQYYKENFFSNDTLYHAELNGGRYGVAGDPVPYSMRSDDFITGFLIVCFIQIAVALSQISGFFAHQCKNFFYSSKIESTMTETGNEVRFQLLFVLITSLLFALLYYFYAKQYISDTYILTSEYGLFGILSCVMIAYFLVKSGLYTMVNSVFFSRKKHLQFSKTMLFITSLEGGALFPLVLLLAYFQLSTQNAIVYCIIILAFAKLMTFYKTYVIFFKQKRLFLQIFLYFCALEMIPLVVLWNGLSVITNILKVNY